MTFKLLKVSTILVCLMCLFASTAYADRDRRDRHRPAKSNPDLRLDKRYDHNRSYWREGHVLRALPRERHPIRYKNKNYFYFSGTWYLPRGPEYIVVRPPIGIMVPILPPFYTTIWFGDTAYYYANGTYYLWRSDLNAYQVTELPEKEKEAKVNYMADKLFIYPKKGQSEQKQADDRYTCHRFGADETGYDPTQPPSDLTANDLSRKRKDYHTAMKTCLEAKGYSVR